MNPQMMVAIMTGKLAELKRHGDRGDENVSVAMWVGISLAVAAVIAVAVWAVVNGLVAKIHL